MKIVLDTNVLVAGLLSPGGPPARILDGLTVGEAMLCFDARILAEYDEALRRPKFGFDAILVSDVLQMLEDTGERIVALPLSTFLPDPADAMFLEVALAGNADHLVTGNLRHFPAKARAGVSVLSPAEFLRAADW